MFLFVVNSFSNTILHLLQDQPKSVIYVSAQIESDSNDLEKSLSNFLCDEEGRKILDSESQSNSQLETAPDSKSITEPETPQFETTVPENTHEADSEKKSDVSQDTAEKEDSKIDATPSRVNKPAGPKKPPKSPGKRKPTKLPSGTRKKPTTRANKTTKVKIIRILPTDDGLTKPKRTPKSTINVQTMIVTDRRGVPRRITLTPPSTRGSTFTFPPWFYNSSYTFPEYSGEEDIPAIYKGQTTTLVPDISESMDEYSYFTTMNAEKRKRSEMKRLFTWPIPTEYRPFYEWYYKCLKDISGRNRRMEGAEHLLIDVNYSEEKPSTPFIIPEKLLTYFLYVNKMNKVLKLDRYWR